jgi:2-polyprenyl-6-hydroxyphenyl methylase/3-demethylubiquinone-9 3-methyltransferase
MPVDNSIYDRLADTWWSQDGLLHAMGPLLNPARLAYFRQVLSQRVALVLPGLRVLDLGCGGGLLAEEFARLGCDVSGVDPSARSVAVARRHACAQTLDITYLVGVGEALPFPDAAFDAVIYADVLEHVRDMPRVVRQAARVLRPGGVFLYETVNRTWLSWLLVIKLLQDWPATRLLPAHLHAHDALVRPRELRHAMSQAGIEWRDTVGIQPPVRPLRLLWTALQLRLGRISHQTAAERLPMVPSRLTALGYMGYGVKGAAAAS